MQKRQFGNKIKLPSVVQIKHQILVRWFNDQTLAETKETGGVREQCRNPGKDV
jgi:hypothetical protein